MVEIDLPSLPFVPCANIPVSVSPINQFFVASSICGVMPLSPLSPSEPFKDSSHSVSVPTNPLSTAIS